MAKGKKKNQAVTTLSLGEFLESRGEGEIPIIKEIVEDGKTKIINLSQAPIAPKSSFEITIRPHILNAGPPFYLVAKNIPFDSGENEIKEFFDQNPISIEMQFAEGNRPKGIAIVGFDTIETYKTALEKDGMKMGIRSINISQGRTIYQFEDLSFKNKKKGRYQINENLNSSIEGNWRAHTFEENAPKDSNRRGYSHYRNSNGGEQLSDLSCLRDAQTSAENNESCSGYGSRGNRNRQNKNFSDSSQVDLSVLRNSEKVVLENEISKKIKDIDIEQKHVDLSILRNEKRTFKDFSENPFKNKTSERNSQQGTPQHNNHQGSFKNDRYNSRGRGSSRGAKTGYGRGSSRGFSTTTIITRSDIPSSQSEANVVP